MVWTTKGLRDETRQVGFATAVGSQKQESQKKKCPERWPPEAEVITNPAKQMGWVISDPFEPYTTTELLPQEPA